MSDAINLESLIVRFVKCKAKFTEIKLTRSKLTKLKAINVKNKHSVKIFVHLDKPCTDFILKMILDGVRFRSFEILRSLTYLKLSNIDTDKYKFHLTCLINLENLILDQNCNIDVENLRKLTYLSVGNNCKCTMVNNPHNLLNLKCFDTFQIDIPSQLTSLTSLIFNTTNNNFLNWYNIKNLILKLTNCRNLKRIEMNENKFTHLQDLKIYLSV